jgi:hypothetical protein
MFDEIEDAKNSAYDEIARSARLLVESINDSSPDDDQREVAKLQRHVASVIMWARAAVKRIIARDGGAPEALRNYESFDDLVVAEYGRALDGTRSTTRIPNIMSALDKIRRTVVDAAKAR